MAALVFGFWGMSEYEQAATGRVDVWSVVYHTLQLFVLHGPLLDDRYVHWQLHVGQLAGAYCLGWAAVTAFFKVFPDEWNLIKLRLRWTGGHVVVCGLGDLGLRLALQGRQQRRWIVAIEKACPATVRQLMRNQRMIVLDGDATDEVKLKAAKVHRAESVVVTCPDDETNIAVAAAVVKILASTNERKAPLVCRTLIGSPQTRHLLRKQGLFLDNRSRYRVNFSDLDRHVVAARQALRLYPLDFKPIRESDETQVRLVVVGFGVAGQGLALHAAQIGHFANEVGKAKRRLRLTIVDSTEVAVNEFKTRYTNLERVIDVDTANAPAKSDLLPWLADLSTLEGSCSTQVTCAFCWEDDRSDELNFRFGMELSERIKARAAQVLIHQNSSKGFAALLSEDNGGTAVGGRIHAFGMVEDVFDWSVVVHEKEDKLASALHEDYRKRRLEAGDSPDQHPVWNELSDELKDSNRQAADHIPIKLRAIGYHEEPRRKDDDKARIVRFEEHEVDLLARMEHARWCAERFLAGWTYGVRTDRVKKINRCLVEWDKLPPEEQRKDPEQINTILSALKSVGCGVYR